MMSAGISSQAGATLGVPRHVQQVAQGPGKHDDEGQCKAREKQPVLTGKKRHGPAKTLA